MKFNPMVAAGVLVFAMGLAVPQRVQAADCRNYCYDQYLQCIASGADAIICARERSNCNRTCTSTPVRGESIVREDALDRIRVSSCGQLQAMPKASITG